MVEWWYNMTFHSSIGMSRFQDLYGFAQPFQVMYIPRDSLIAAVDDLLRNRDAIVPLL